MLSLFGSGHHPLANDRVKELDRRIGRPGQTTPPAAEHTAATRLRTHYRTYSHDVTARDAAMLLGVVTSTVPKLVARCELTSYGHRPGGCLDLAEVEDLVTKRDRARESRSETRAKGRVRRRV